MMSALRLLPPAGWTAIVAWLATPGWGGDETQAMLAPVLRWLFPGAGPGELLAWHGLARKAAHVAEYAVLGALWYWALRPRGAARAAGGALLLSAATAALDELYQSTTGARGGSAADAGLDVAGALAAVAVAWAGPAAAAARLTAVLLWAAAAGGTALLALHWGAGADPGWLPWSVPAAWLALAARGLRGRRRRRAAPRQDA